MKISTKGRYGLRALVDLAGHPGGENISLTAIAKRQELSPGYLESIFSSLKKAGLIVGAAGAKGGYRLAAPAEEISVRVVLEALEGDMSVTDHAAGGSRLSSFLNRVVWERVDESVAAALENTTLADLVQQMDIPV